jgi:NodT family efflux transporter outer membrane factor (OMF) lipoprotein
LLVIASAGCASLRTDLSVPEKALPAAFESASGGPNIAQMKWRNWFGDAHLNRLVTEAVANNHDLQIALQRIHVTRAGVLAATGARLPQVWLAAGSSLQKVGLYTTDGAGNAGTDITPGRRVPVHLPDLALGLQASWEVDLWGRLRHQRASAVAQYLASMEGTNLVLTSLIADVATAYFELLALDHAREILGQSVKRQEEALEVVRLQKAAGRANELAVQQFEAQLAETRALEREASREIIETENRLNTLLGRYPQAVSRNKDVLFAEIAAKPSAGVPSDLLRNRPDIREAELQVQAAQYDLKAARAAFFPSFTITAGAGFQAFNPAYLLKVPQSLTYSVAGGLMAPLVNRRGLEAQFAGANANQIQAMYNYQKAILVAYVEVANALSSIGYTEEILELRKAQKAAMVQTVATADMLYRAGKASYLEVLMAQQSSLRADLELIEIWKRRRIANVIIYKALGGGWR